MRELCQLKSELREQSVKSILKEKRNFRSARELLSNSLPLFEWNGNELTKNATCFFASLNKNDLFLIGFQLQLFSVYFISFINP